jgi:hypothetical protein
MVSVSPDVDREGSAFTNSNHDAESDLDAQHGQRFPSPPDQLPERGPEHGVMRSLHP